MQISDRDQDTKITELGQSKNLKAQSHDEEVIEVDKRSLLFSYISCKVNIKKTVEKVGKCKK